MGFSVRVTEKSDGICMVRNYKFAHLLMYTFVNVSVHFYLFNPQ